VLAFATLYFCMFSALTCSTSTWPARSWADSRSGASATTAIPVSSRTRESVRSVSAPPSRRAYGDRFARNVPACRTAAPAARSRCAAASTSPGAAGPAITTISRPPIRVPFGSSTTVGSLREVHDAFRYGGEASATRVTPGIWIRGGAAAPPGA
jgi:hypothetical protein